MDLSNNEVHELFTNNVVIVLINCKIKTVTNVLLIVFNALLIVPHCKGSQINELLDLGVHVLVKSSSKVILI